MTEGWGQVWRDLWDSLRGRRGGVEAPKPANRGSRGAQRRWRAGSSERGGLEPERVPAPPQTAVGSSRQVGEDAENEPQPARAGDVSAPEPRRGIITVTVVLLTAGVLAIFWEPTFSLLRAPAPPAPNVVATFEGGRITLTDVEKHLAELVPEDLRKLVRDPEMAIQTIEDLISHVLVQRWAASRRPEKDRDFRRAMRHIDEDMSLDALSMKLHRDAIPVSESEIQTYYRENSAEFGDRRLDEVRERVRRRLVAEREPEFMQNYLERLRANASVTRNFELLDVPEPDDDRLRRYYQANAERYRVPAQVVVDEIEIPSGSATARDAAQRALRRMRAGAALDEAVAGIARAVTHARVTVLEGRRRPDWESRVTALGRGEIAGPFESGGNLYVVRLQERIPEGTLAFEAARAEVAAAARADAEAAWYERNAERTLFTIKGERYTVGRFYDEYRALAPRLRTRYEGPAGARKLAEALIDRLLFARAATDQALDVESGTLGDEARLEVMRQMMDQEEVDDKIAISDEDVRDYMAQNRNRMMTPPKSRIRYIRIGLGAGEDDERRARERADEVYEKLVPGLFGQSAEFASLAREYSEDTDTAANGGEFPGWIEESADYLFEIEMHPLHESVLPLEPGEISEPFVLGDSLYVVQVVERVQPRPLTFEEAAPVIRAALRERQHEEIAADLQTRLIDEAKVIVYREVLDRYLQEFASRRPADAAKSASAESG